MLQREEPKKPMVLKSHKNREREDDLLLTQTNSPASPPSPYEGTVSWPPAPDTVTLSGGWALAANPERPLKTVCLGGSAAGSLLLPLWCP